MENAYAAMLIRPLEGHGITRVNEPFVTTLGFSHEALAAQPLRQWIHPEDWPLVVATLESTRRGETSVCEARHRTADNAWVNMRWHVRTHQGRELVHGTQCNGNIAHNAPASRDPEDGTEGLHETLHVMALTVEARNPGMRCSILLVDSARQCIMGGAAPSLPEAYNQAIEGYLLGPAAGSCGTAAFWNTRVVVENIDTDPLWDDLRATAELAGVKACWSQPVVGSNGDVVGAMALYDDQPRAPTRHQLDSLEIAAKMVGLAIEHHHVASGLRREEKMEALGRLAGGVAHDFNNLLTTILGNIELAINELPLEQLQDSPLHDAFHASESAARMCAQILAYAGRGHASRAPVACNAMIREVGGLMRTILSRDATLQMNLQEEECMVTGDGAQLQSVIMNLLTNASEAVGSSSGTITVRSQVRSYDRDQLLSIVDHGGIAAGEFVELQVSDTGGGIDPETQTRMFDPFFSTKPRNTGLGLAAAQGIVRSHGGALTVSTQSGEGTTFTILLPHAPEAAPPPPPVETHHSIPPNACVLLADDDPMVRGTIARTLERAGIQVILAADGEEAVAVFDRYRGTIGCVLLDYSMPKRNGGEALREIRKLDADIPVLLISGYADYRLTEQYRKDGLYAVIQKPTQRNRLLDQVSQALRHATTQS